MPTVEERFWSRVDFDGPVPEYAPHLGPCWLWRGSLSHGYGSISVNGHGVRVHRLSYELLVGPIPEHLVLDHLCRVTNCVNVRHLEPVTDKVNILRGISFAVTNARASHCPQGHPYDDENTISLNGHWRDCRRCQNAAQVAYRVRVKARAVHETWSGVCRDGSHAGTKRIAQCHGIRRCPGAYSPCECPCHASIATTKHAMSSRSTIRWARTRRELSVVQRAEVRA